MKSIVFLLMLLGLSGCFDRDRGVLTELLIEPAGAPPPAPVQPGLPTKIPAGTGSELVMSPIPAAVEEHLFGDWEDDLDLLAGLLRIPSARPDTIDYSCEKDIYPRVYYDKYIDADGIAIIGPSERTSPRGIKDEWLYLAREVILTMTSEMPGLREVLSVEHPFGFRYVLLGAGWPQDVNLPSELDVKTGIGFFRQTHGGHLAFGGIYFSVDRFNNERESFDPGTVVHEMAHAIDEAFDKNPHLFPDWGARLTAAFEAATAKAAKGDVNFGEGFYSANHYAMQNEKEYWAVGAGDWFTNFHGGLLHGDEWNRQDMLRSDPLLYALLDEVFPVADYPRFIELERD